MPDEIFKYEPSADEQIRFLLYIQRLLAEGQFTSTYKFALVLAIANLCVEKLEASGTRFLEIDARALSEQFIDIYWRQSIPFRGVVLKQNTGNQATIITQIERARSDAGGSLFALRSDHRRWNALVSRIAGKIVEMPLWKLQTLDGESAEYLYSSADSAKTIRIPAGIAFCFRRFHGLVIELVQSAWLQFVRRQPTNKLVLGADGDLEGFMFGTDRRVLGKFVPIFRETQSDQCFYCASRLSTETAEVGHFIPWSRYRSDLGHNFVLAHQSCNRDKLDRLAGLEYLDRWTKRNSEFGTELAVEFQKAGLIYDQRTTNQIARFAYEQVETTGSSVWLGKRNRLTQLTSDWRDILV